MCENGSNVSSSYLSVFEGEMIVCLGKEKEREREWILEYGCLYLKFISFLEGEMTVCMYACWRFVCTFAGAGNSHCPVKQATHPAARLETSPLPSNSLALCPLTH